MKKWIKIAVITPFALVLTIFTAIFICGFVLYRSADMKQPDIEVDMDGYELSVYEDSLRICKNNSLVLNDYGLWEVKLEGSATERGAAFGKMADDLLYYQEKVFVDFIKDLIPSDGYLRFLRIFLEIFNRNMASYIPQTDREEIYAMSLSCTHEFDIFGNPYERQMHYNAAHDIGHMMQQYMLVGCTSFVVKGTESEDGKLLVGRNFDFYVGDDFARNKLVYFISPDEGYKYMSISWAGLSGVVSGMNEKGLTLTMNAAKGDIPTSSAMPVSLLAKKILMEAETIEEAYAIAAESSLFVSESLLIASAADGRAAIIEKTPDDIALYSPDGERIICSNHFQSEYYADDRYNIENMENSDSKYRYNRMSELISDNIPINPEKAVTILRDRTGLGGKDIGLYNEKSVNQSIAHHSLVFRPEDLQVWVSTGPWQAGAFLCYDLKEIFGLEGPAEKTLSLKEKEIVPDKWFIDNIYPRILEYRREAATVREAVARRGELSEKFIVDFIGNNSEFYDSYNLVGDYYCSRKEMARAAEFWGEALKKEIPRKEIERTIAKKLEDYD